MRFTISQEAYEFLLKNADDEITRHFRPPKFVLSAPDVAKATGYSESAIRTLSPRLAKLGMAEKRGKDGGRGKWWYAPAAIENLGKKETKRGRPTHNSN